MKICLELHSETLAEFRAELETFLTPGAIAAATVPTGTNTATGPAIVEPVIAMVSTGTTKVRLAPAPKGERARSAADIALGLDPEADVTTTADASGPATGVAPQPDIEDLLADKAQLHFNFDRVLALQGRAAALGIVRGVLPAGTKAKLKDLEALPVALIPAAIAALQAAQEA
jgi:hypothetical protein